MSKSPKITVTDPTNSAVVTWKQTYSGTTSTDTLGPGQSKSYSGIFSASVAPLSPAATVQVSVENDGDVPMGVQHEIPAGGAETMTAHGGQYSGVSL